MDKIKVQISNQQKDIKIPSGIRLLIRRCCTAVLNAEQFEGSAEVDVSFVSDEQIRELNSTHRGKAIETDVLSFPLGDGGKYDLNHETGLYMLGDIVISVERAMEQAELYGHTLQREIGFLTVHSMLHLLGYDHEGEKLATIMMREKEEDILAALGLTRDLTYVTPEG